VGFFRDWLDRVPTDDPFERKSAATVQVFCIGLILLIGANEIDQVLRGDVATSGFARYGVFADLASMAASFVGIVLIRRGNIREGFATVLGSYLLILAGSLVFRGLAYHQNLLVRVFWVLLVMPALLLGRRELWGALAVLLSAMLVGYLRDTGHLGGTGPLAPPDPAFGVWVQAVAVMVLLCIILDRFGAALREAYSVARTRQREAERASDALSAANRSLAAEMERRAKAEALLYQSQKLEAIGRLSAGVAHDFNNVLTGILGFSELVKGSLPAENPIRDDVDQIIAAADRASALTKQLLAFARRQIVEPTNVSIQERTSALQPMLKKLLGENIAIVERFDAVPGRVYVDQVQLDQVLLNLALNARDAMPDGGALTITTEDVDLSADDLPSSELAPGPYVRLSVSDTGIGMTPSTLENVFEPFFTTKGQGKGTGLGLATCYGIVRQADGAIIAHSVMGEGTTFEILLPRVSAEESLPAVVRSGFVRRKAAPPGGETVLVVEDEPSILEIAARVLRNAGYAVLTAKEPAEAMAVAVAHRGEIALLLTDVVMPGSDGRTFAEELRRTRPDIVVLYMSGYSDDVIARHGVLDNGIELLPKPFSPEALTFKVREALDARRRGAIAVNVSEGIRP
jgi:signal transduction histidine kinase/ActR/RegA family two-component response regulator